MSYYHWKVQTHADIIMASLLICFPSSFFSREYILDFIKENFSHVNTLRWEVYGLLSIYKTKPAVISVAQQAPCSVYGFLYIAPLFFNFLKDRNDKFKTWSLLFMQTCSAQEGGPQTPMLFMYYLHINKTNKLQTMIIPHGLDMMFLLK